MCLDVHLMIMNPMKYIDNFADFGADIITFHVESDCEIIPCINAIHKHGIKAAVAIRPNTPAESVFEFLPYHEYGKDKWTEKYEITDGFVSEETVNNFNKKFEQAHLKTVRTQEELL